MYDSFKGVRLAVPEDEDALYKMLCLNHKENGIYPMNESKVREFIRHATQRQGGMIGVIEGENYLEGSVGLTLETWWYTDRWSIGERWNFVHPNHRRTDHAKKLIKFAKWVADNMKLDLEMGVMSNERTEAKVRLYRRQLPCVGAFFLYKVS